MNQDGAADRTLRAQLERERAIHRALIDIGLELTQMLHLPDLIERIMHSARELLHAESSVLLLVDKERQELYFEYLGGAGGEETQRLSIPMGTGIAGWVAQTGQPTMVNDVRLDPRFSAEVDQRTGFHTRSILAVPLQARGETIAVAEVVNKHDGAFDAQDLELCQAIAGFAAVAIDNAMLYRRLADAVIESRFSYRL